jgi:hypothetical protein
VTHIRDKLEKVQDNRGAATRPAMGDKEQIEIALDMIEAAADALSVS